MKPALVIAFTFLVSFAEAAQVQQEIHCYSETHELSYVEDIKGEGDYILSNLDEDIPALSQSFVALPLKDKNYEAKKLAAPVVFEKISSIRLGAPKDSQDGLSNKREWRTRQGLKFVKVTPEARERLGVMAGDLMTFYCEQSTVVTQSKIEASTP